MQDHPSFVCMPALGDATTEATDNSEAMAAAQLARFLEEGGAARRQRGRCRFLVPQRGRPAAAARPPGCLWRTRPLLGCSTRLRGEPSQNRSGLPEGLW
jgi:hypothetical protein